MKVSIVMTTYQGEQFIEQQLQSLMQQSRKADEVLICDDRSTDKTVILMEQFIQHHQLKHWQVIVNEHRLGFKENFRQGLSKSQGDIIFLCDQDDVWKPNKIETLLHCFEQQNVLSVASGFERIDPSGNVIDEENQHLLDFEVKEKEVVEISLEYLLKKNYAQGCTMAIRKEVVNQYLHKDSGPLEHDWSLSLISALQHGCYFYNEALIRYRIHEHNTIGLSTSDTATIRKERTNDRIIAVLEEEKRIDFVLQYPELWKDKQQILQQKKAYYCFRTDCLKRHKGFLLAMRCLFGTYRKQATFSATMGDLVYLFKKSDSMKNGENIGDSA